MLLVAWLHTVDVTASGLINQRRRRGVRRNSNFATVQLLLLRHAVSRSNGPIPSSVGRRRSLAGSAADRESYIDVDSSL